LHYRLKAFVALVTNLFSIFEVGSSFLFQVSSTQDHSFVDHIELVE
jgi:hypothetical protein